MPFLQTPQLSSARVGGGAIAITISSNISNYNLANDLTNNYGWDGVSAIEVDVTINAGVSVTATSTGTPAFVASLFSGSTFTLTNFGTITGATGAQGANSAGSGPGSPGGAGGNGLSVANCTATINNESTGTISGGGGGGGGYGCSRGQPNFVEGNCDGTTITNCGTAGSTGGLGQAGTAGTAGSTAGIAPQCLTFGAGGAGGAAGKAIDGTHTLNNSGTINGATS